MGFLWVIATVAFEFLFGAIERLSLAEMLQAYNILTGNLWLLIVIFMGFAPTIVARLKKIIK